MKLELTLLSVKNIQEVHRKPIDYIHKYLRATSQPQQEYLKCQINNPTLLICKNSGIKQYLMSFLV